MSTVVAVRKNGIAVIAADTLTKWGSGKESAAYVVNHEKIVEAGESYIGVTGSATFKHVLRDYFSEMEEPVELGNVAQIFRTWNQLHGALKEHYYLQTGDKDDELESTQMDVLIVNAHGIFGVAAHRTVQEFSKFYAYGSGSSYALGALYTLYDQPDLSAEDLARRAVEAAAEFDDQSGLPLTMYSIPLANT
jgi:ATP-dependent HslUV protease subunit HslV